MANKQVPDKRSDSDRLAIALACLATITAIILFIVEKTRTTIIILLLSMALLAIQPIWHFLPSKRLRTRIFVFVAFVAGTLFFGYLVWPKTAGKHALAVAAIGINGTITVGGRPTLVVNEVNTTGDTIKARQANGVFIIATPKDYQTRTEKEDLMWQQLENSYRDSGLDQDIPAREEGLTNLQITPPPLNDREARSLQDRTSTIYYLGVTRNRETQEDLVKVCVFIDPSLQRFDCAKNNLP